MHGFDLQDWQGDLIADLFPSNDGKAGQPWRDHRAVLDGMVHVPHTGCPWRDPPDRHSLERRPRPVSGSGAAGSLE